MFLLYNSSAVLGVAFYLVLTIGAKVFPAFSNCDLKAVPLFSFQSMFVRAGKNAVPMLGAR